MLTYKTISFSLIASLLMALFFVFLGTDSLSYVIQGKYFISDLLISFLLGFALLTYLSALTKYLEQRYSWQKDFSKRVVYQIISGVLIPALFVFAGMYGYFFAVLDFKHQEVHFFYTEYPFAIVLIIAINITYAAYFFYQENKQQRHNLVNLEQQLYTLQNLSVTPQPSLQTELNEINEETEAENKIKTFIAVSGNKNIPISVEEICCFYKEGNYTQLKTFQSKTFLLNHTLDDLTRLLDELKFFRANRQFIINRKACHYFTNEDNGKLELFLNPPHDQEVIISQKRATAFKDWLNR